jgi:hypothetical protein
MAQDPEYLHVPIPAGCRSREVALFLGMMDDQLRLLTEGTRGLTVEQLGWQPAPGMNTIGMLLAHIAVVEVFWTDYVLEGLDRDQVRFREIIGLVRADAGMPLPEGAAPPAILAGKDLAFFDSALARARGHLRVVASKLSDADLTRRLDRPTPAGQKRVIDVRWGLYHLFEHFSGHYNQILLLKHAHQAGLHVHTHS